MIRKCRECKEAISYGIDDLLLGNAPKLKKTLHIIKLKKHTGLCDECYYKNEVGVHKK